VLADGRSLRLSGIQMPRMARGAADAWPFAEAAHARLAALLREGPTLLRHAGPRAAPHADRHVDRHGRVWGFPAAGDGRAVQFHLLEEGLARVETTPDSRACAGMLLAAEQAARAAGRGIWSDPFYAIRDAADAAALERLEGSFQLVEGVVKEAASVRGRLYLNFGADRRTDFTVTVAPAGVKLFQNGIRARLAGDPSMLAGQRVRVRGWIGRFNGPQIAVSHPEQIELLDERNEPARQNPEGEHGSARHGG